MCKEFWLWWLVETLLILQENLFDFLLELGVPVSKWMFSEPALGRNQLLRVELDVVESWRVYFFCPPDQSLLLWEFLSKLFTPQARRNRRVFRVMLCSRIGGISKVSKKKKEEKWSDIHSNEPNKILWLNWFLEAPFLKYFSQIVAIHHEIHPSSRHQFRKSSFLCSAYRYSAISFLFLSANFSSFPPILTVDWSSAAVMRRTSPLFSIPLFFER